jgi:hypothetical protein
MRDSFFSIDEVNITILPDFGVFFLSAIIHKPWPVMCGSLTSDLLCVTFIR